jgi:hypothetical protein
LHLLGQWSPIAGTCLAAVGSLLVYATSDKPPKSVTSDHSQCGHSTNRLQPCPSQDTYPERSPDRTSNGHSTGSRDSTELRNMPTIEEPPTGSNEERETEQNAPGSVSNAGRGAVRKWLERASIYISDVAHDRLDTSGFPDRRAPTYPWVPGEEYRNTDIYITSNRYDTIREQQLRAASYAASATSTSGAERASPLQSPASPRPETSPLRVPVRQDTLTVPAPAHTSPRVGNQHGWN